jgi:predicted protein tyrosine phosphatase
MRNKYLTVCLCHEDRSPVAAEVLEKLLNIEGIESEVDSNGMYFIEQDQDQDKVRQQLNGYDKIFVMEDYMKKRLEKIYGIPSDRMVVLNIPDIFDSAIESEKEELKRRLESALMPHLKDGPRNQDKNQ